ncbi:hypothetical protein HanOQP8_Chr14g0509831 [Helianthus annuus]|nr:hypothetical protein HanHA89_Chr14g0542381 [Helianthus annuus]KAJ0658580.1 hypothetical protein HanOQP8_Chr14g0509831 [Helianthus annuus]
MEPTTIMGPAATPRWSGEGHEQRPVREQERERERRDGERERLRRERDVAER